MVIITPPKTQIPTSEKQNALRCCVQRTEARIWPLMEHDISKEVPPPHGGSKEEEEEEESQEGGGTEGE